MATSTKTKKKVFVKVSMEQATEAAHAYAIAAHQIAKKEAELNTKLAAVRKEYDSELITLKSEQEEPIEIMEAYANENKADWGKKSLDLSHCVIGFRTGNPTVTKTKTGISWDGMVEFLRKAGLTRFIRTKDEVNKEAILAEREESLISQLKENFIVVKQDESFYVEAKTEAFM